MGTGDNPGRVHHRGKHSLVGGERMTFLLYAVIVLLSLLALVVGFILVVFLIDLVKGIINGDTH